MKLKIYKTCVLILITLSLATTVSPLAAQIYKTVDADGNVIYTDRPPADGSKPVDLPEISVIEAPVYEKAPKANIETEETKDMSLRDMRRNYIDFAIISPQSEESIWHPDQAISIVWNVRHQLQAGMKVTIFLNGQPQATTNERVILLDSLERGEYIVTAELKDARNRKVATAKPVTFYIRRPGLRSRPGTGAGGG